MLTSIVNPNHWANRGCVGWWPALPGRCYGSKVYAAYGQYDFTLTNSSGTDARQGIIWSPTVGTNAGALSSVALRAGALGNAFLGPFKYASTTWYGASSIDISASCPTEGTMALWLRPQDNSTLGYVVSQYSLASNIYFRILRNGSPPTDYLQAGFYKASATTVDAIARYGSPLSLTSWVHVAFTWKDSATTLLYVNGAQVAASSQNYSSAWSLGSTLSIGFNTITATYPSIEGVDDLCLWNRRLSDNEIWSVYSQSLAGWSNRIVKSPWLRWPTFRVPSSYSFSGIGGVPQGGYAPRTSSWIMPSIGGITDGGHASRSNEFAVVSSGGVRDGGITTSPLAWDRFAGIAPTLLTAHQPNDGGAWTKHPSYLSGDARLDGSGNVYSTTANLGVFLHSWAPPSADYTVSCDCWRWSGGGSSSIGVGARWDSSSNTGYYAYVSNIGPTIHLSRALSGSIADLATAGIPWFAGQSKRLSLSVVGSSLWVYWDGVLKLGPVTDLSIASAGRAGLVTLDANVSAHDWMSSGGGVQARFAPTPSGGESLGGKYSSGSFFAWAGSGGIGDGGFSAPVKASSFSGVGGFELSGHYTGPTYTYVGAGGILQGAESGFLVTFHPPTAGGISDGGRAIWASGWVLSAAGGMRDGGHTSAGNNVYIEVGVGGIFVGSEAKNRFQGRHKATGGMDQSGVASRVKTYFATPSGGMRHGSYVAATKTVVVSALASQIHGGVVLGLSMASSLFGSGGMELGSEPIPSWGTTCDASGGIAAGGEGDRSAVYRPEATGGMSEGGVSLPGRSTAEVGSGGLRDGGSKRAVMGFAPDGSGGLAAGGEPLAGHGTLFVGTGGLDRGGQTIDLMAFGPEVSGGMIQSAETQFALDYVNTFSGGTDQAAIAPNTLDITSIVSGGGLSHGGRAAPVPTVQIREAIFDRLVTSPQIMASTGGRIYFGGLPQTCRLEDGPAIVFFIVSRSYGRSLRGPNETSIARVHLAACSFDEAEADRLTQLVRHRFQGFAGIQYGQLILSCKLENDLDAPEAPVAGTDQWVYQVGTEYSISHRVRIPSFVPRPA